MSFLTVSFLHEFSWLLQVLADFRHAVISGFYLLPYSVLAATVDTCTASFLHEGGPQISERSSHFESSHWILRPVPDGQSS